ncbi:cupredoxin domain-containing protein [Thalassospira sp. TSL5-1]|uniref:cupredoxin domain-containing protein n=1 Tax=Thalassospira sp. TSL5-1 TaxID=1544451 RepID=UPI00093F9DCD|nr:cupredoxin domain-containing protein [Thalassospira sp. TSL5-1]OKH86578.1 copper-binding protein [Thalassospira sp. TSL5-1]
MPAFKSSFAHILSLAVLSIGVTFLAPVAAYADAGHKNGMHATDIGAPGIPADAKKTIEIIMQDNFFEPEKIVVQGGETVRFVIRNEGEFVHEFNIGTIAMHAAHQKEMEMMVEHGVLEADKINMQAMNMDMGNGMSMKHDDPNSVLIEPGKTAEIIWKFPENADLEFACNIPGHYQSGMMGQVKFQ